jgi:hypothetical protein
MNYRPLVMSVMLVVWVLGTVTTSWACKSAGPNKHVGQITAIDAKADTFTIRDAETNHAITFEATEKILKDLKINDRVMVGYKDVDGKMKAIDVRS